MGESDYNATLTSCDISVIIYKNTTKVTVDVRARANLTVDITPPHQKSMLWRLSIIELEKTFRINNFSG